jgi:hypothetical protein
MHIDEVERRWAPLRQTRALSPYHRLIPWFTEDAARGRSHRLLDCTPDSRLWIGVIGIPQPSGRKEF